PLSVLREDGTPECRFADSARPLVEGGQSIQWEFCRGRGTQKCEFYDECRARDGVEGPENTRITVGTHALLAELDTAAGATGLLCIDEPPRLLTNVTLSIADFETTVGALAQFHPRYADAMRPVLRALHAWTERCAEIGAVVAVGEALRGAVH